jgi:hypothetical protein
MPRSRTTRWTPRFGSSWPRRPTPSTAPRASPASGCARTRGSVGSRCRSSAPRARRVEAQVAAAKAAGVTSLLFDRASGLPWTQPNLEAGQRRFIRRFAEIRQAAIDAAIAAEDELAAELEQLQFRDFRRTAVVFLGELGIADHLIAAITGHTLDETKRILETYMPRTTGMAARAIALSQARKRRRRSRSRAADGRLEQGPGLYRRARIRDLRRVGIQQRAREYGSSQLPCPTARYSLSPSTMSR